jgi:hypothetical protein
MRTAKLLVANQMVGNANVLLGDGSWATVQDGTAVPNNTGLDLPLDCLRELAHALNDFLGDTRTNEQLQAELRHEQQRVDELHRGILNMLGPATGGYLSTAQIGLTP